MRLAPFGLATSASIKVACLGLHDAQITLSETAEAGVAKATGETFLYLALAMHALDMTMMLQANLRSDEFICRNKLVADHQLILGDAVSGALDLHFP
jgi:hypothetical protein